MYKEATAPPSPYQPKCTSVSSTFIGSDMPHIVYLHGFNSSEQSAKAHETGAFLGERGLAAQFHCPRLPPHPADAIAAATALLQTLPADTLLIGSSLGGFYASWLAEALDLRAVLINPAIYPDRSLAGFLGPQTNPYTGEQYTLDEADLTALRRLHVGRPTPERYWLVLGTADEVLDWREAAHHYRGARQTVFNGDDHRLARWTECLPGVLAFAAGS